MTKRQRIGLLFVLASYSEMEGMNITSAQDWPTWVMYAALFAVSIIAGVLLISD